MLAGTDPATPLSIHSVNSHVISDNHSSTHVLSSSNSTNQQASSPLRLQQAPGQPLTRTAPTTSTPAPIRVTASQRRLIGNVSASVERYAARRRSLRVSQPLQSASSVAAARQSVVSAAETGLDRVSPTDTIDSLVRQQFGSIAPLSSSSSFNPTPTATGKPVEFISAAKVSLPAHAATADLVRLLPTAGGVRDRYATPNPDLLYNPLTDEPRSPTPRPVFMITYAEYVLLIRRMYAAGMVTFTTEPVVVNGVFGVPKDGGASTRLIIDARPANAHFKLPPHVDLPGPDHIAALQVPSNREVFVAKADIDNFYHRLKCPEWLQYYFGLPAITARDVSPFVAQLFGAETRINPMCATLPMGWSHSVFVAQSAHEELVSNIPGGGMQPVDRIGAVCAGFTGDMQLRPGRVMHAVYIDDVSWFGTDAGQIRAIQSAYVGSATGAGLAVKPSKLVPPTRDAVDILGIEFSGSEHTFGLSAAKLELLVTDTSALIAEWQRSKRQHRITGLTLAHMIGRWTWAMLCNRLLLSTFNSVYRFIECADRRAYVLWPSVIAELGVAVGLAPLMFSRLSSIVFESVIATDASDTGRGVVAHTPSPAERSVRLTINSVDHPSLPAIGHIAEEAERHRHIITPAPAAPRQEGNIPAAVVVDAKQSLDTPLRSIADVRWATIVSDRWRRSGEHINTLELRALETGVRWVVSHPLSIGMRIVMLTDSMVVHGAVRKGRSSAPALLRRLRALASVVLAAGLQLDVRWVPSECNPADAPSRM